MKSQQSASPGAPRRSFALAGPRTKLDPRTNAVRGDLADIRLAEYVFAPHYAAPLAMVAAAPADLREGPEETAVVIATLAKGDVFEVLDLAAGRAWGFAPAAGLAGYVDRASLVAADPS